MQNCSSLRAAIPNDNKLPGRSHARNRPFSNKSFISLWHDVVCHNLLQFFVNDLIESRCCPAGVQFNSLKWVSCTYVIAIAYQNQVILYLEAFGRWFWLSRFWINTMRLRHDMGHSVKRSVELGAVALWYHFVLGKLSQLANIAKENLNWCCWKPHILSCFLTFSWHNAICSFMINFEPIILPVLIRGVLIDRVLWWEVWE